MAYRRKTFMTSGDYDNPFAASNGTVIRYRWRCEGVTPSIVIEVTEVGGSTTTETIYPGAMEELVGLAPNQVTWIRPKVAVSANASYEVAVSTTSYARLASFSA